MFERFVSLLGAVVATVATVAFADPAVALSHEHAAAVSSPSSAPSTAAPPAAG